MWPVVVHGLRPLKRSGKGHLRATQADHFWARGTYHSTVAILAWQPKAVEVAPIRLSLTFGAQSWSDYNYPEPRAFA